MREGSARGGTGREATDWWIYLAPRSDGVLLEHLLSSLSLCLSLAGPGQLSLSWDLFHELLVFLSVLLDSRMADEAGFGSPSEERTLQALNCLKYLLISSAERYIYFLTPKL